jgi:hypothetical protein
MRQHLLASEGCDALWQLANRYLECRSHGHLFGSRTCVAGEVGARCCGCAIGASMRLLPALPAQLSASTQDTADERSKQLANAVAHNHSAWTLPCELPLPCAM